MEEKERYEIKMMENGYKYIYDNEQKVPVSTFLQEIPNLLNQQDKEIKKFREFNDKYPYHYSEEYMENNRTLEYENKLLKELKVKGLGEALASAFETIAAKLKDIINQIDTPTFIDIMQKSDQLQNKKAIEELEKLKNFLVYEYDIKKVIDNQIKELRGGENAEN